MINLFKHPVKWSEKTIKKFRWYDVKLAQWASILAVLTLIAAWPAFLELVLKVNWYWYLIATIIFGLPLIKRMFFEE